MPKEPYPAPTPPQCRESLGLAPAILAKRDVVTANPWCPIPPNIEYDKNCDANHPKTIHYSHIFKANSMLKDIVPPTPLLKSKCCKKFKMELYLKIETVHRTGSFHERSAIYALLMLTPQQRADGVYTASVGNWAMALAYHSGLLKVPVTVVLPVDTGTNIVDQCEGFGATVILHGNTVADAKRRAFILISENGRIGTYLNGYDHPHVISGAGTIGMELFEQLPDVEAILIPIGGGGLIAGISSAIKHLKPDTLIYGVEPEKSCSFFKAMDNEYPYKIETQRSLANSLTVPRAGDNAFHTARSLIDKMVLVDDDWTARAVLYLAEQENLVVEGAGAISVGALLSIPDVLPELHGKKVICIISGGNIGTLPLTWVLARGKAVEGRYVTVLARLIGAHHIQLNKILKVIASLGCSIIDCQVEREWLTEDKLVDTYINIQCETKDLRHAYTLKRVMDKLFPGTCDFCDNTFQPINTCYCFPRRTTLS